MKVLKGVAENLYRGRSLLHCVFKSLASKFSHHSWKHAWLKGAIDNGFNERLLQLRMAIWLPNSHHTFVKLDLWAIRSFSSVMSSRNQQYRDIAGKKKKVLIFLYGWRIFTQLLKNTIHGKTCNGTGKFTGWETVAKEQIVMENLCSLMCSSNDSLNTCVAEVCACTPMLC